jgi:hypothetical protein
MQRLRPSNLRGNRENSLRGLCRFRTAQGSFDFADGSLSRTVCSAQDDRAFFSAFCIHFHAVVTMSSSERVAFQFKTC